MNIFSGFLILIAFGVGLFMGWIWPALWNVIRQKLSRVEAGI